MTCSASSHTFHLLSWIHLYGIQVAGCLWPTSSKMFMLPVYAPHIQILSKTTHAQLRYNNHTHINMLACPYLDYSLLDTSSINLRNILQLSLPILKYAEKKSMHRYWRKEVNLIRKGMVSLTWRQVLTCFIPQPPIGAASLNGSRPKFEKMMSQKIIFLLSSFGVRYKKKTTTSFVCLPPSGRL